ncbi:hypothetical protein IAT38_007031 [Cryptococcus sp. DSM 104549]
MNDQQQADNDALANAVAASAHQLGLASHLDQHDPHAHAHNQHAHHQPHAHHFHHALQQPDFSQHKEGEDGSGMDVHALDIPTVDEQHHHVMDHGEPELDLNLGNIGTPGDMDGIDMGDMDHSTPDLYSSGRPPSIRKACDLCHAAKQKCSGDRPSCSRCAAGGWPCNYAPRQRRRTVPKEQKHLAHHSQHPHQHHAVHSGHHSPLEPIHQAHTPIHAHHVQQPVHNVKKRKITRDSITGFGSEAMDIKMAMGMAMDMGLTGEEEGEELQTVTEEQMLESIAVDGYLSDLPLATFVHNLPFTAPEQPQVFGNDFPSSSDNPFPNTDMDQHTTSALRDAIFSLNESSGGGANHGEEQGQGEGNDGQDGEGEQMDPHLALLDLSNMNNDGEGGDGQHDPTGGLNLGDFATSQPLGCNHRSLVQHILALLTQHTLDPKPGSNTPLTLAVFTPLARSLRLWHSIVQCHSCINSPQQTLPQLALLSRTCTILTFPFPPINSSSVGSSAQITIHGARIAGTGLSEAIEQHIVGVVWDSWRASVREVFAALDKKAQEVITQSAQNAAAAGNGGQGGQGGSGGNAEGGQNGTGGQGVSSLEKQRAGLVFQAVSRLVTAMDEVEAS